MRPHLYIYVGASTDATLKNIKNKNVPYIANSKALTRDYIDAIGRYAGNYIFGARYNDVLEIFQQNAYKYKSLF